MFESTQLYNQESTLPLELQQKLHEGFEVNDLQALSDLQDHLDNKRKEIATLAPQIETWKRDLKILQEALNNARINKTHTEEELDQWQLDIHISRIELNKSQEEIKNWINIVNGLQIELDKLKLKHTI